jgi:hypothetical protein
MPRGGGTAENPDDPIPRTFETPPPLETITNREELLNPTPLLGLAEHRRSGAFTHELCN